MGSPYLSLNETNGLLSDHVLRGPHRCSCGWEGDHATVHLLDVLNGQDVSVRARLVGLMPVGRWRSDVSDQCQHCEPERLYQTWSQEAGFSYDAEDEADAVVFVEATSVR